MAWNPAPEVAVARDAAKRLGDAPVCVVFWVTPNGEQFGYASYGKTKQLCAKAKQLGDDLFDTAREWLADNALPIVPVSSHDPRQKQMFS